MTFLLLHTSNQISLTDDDVNNNKRPASVVFFQSKRALLKNKAYLNKSDRRAPRARRRLSAKRVNKAAAERGRERKSCVVFCFVRPKKSNKKVNASKIGTLNKFFRDDFGCVTTQTQLS